MLSPQKECIPSDAEERPTRHDSKNIADMSDATNKINILFRI